MTNQGDRASLKVIVIYCAWTGSISKKHKLIKYLCYGQCFNYLQLADIASPHTIIHRCSFHTKKFEPIHCVFSITSSPFSGWNEAKLRRPKWRNEPLKL